MNPVFLSLVGSSDYVKQLYDRLCMRIPEQFPDRRFVALADPFKDYRDMKIGGKLKRDFVPEARVCFRWGLFVQYNATVVAKAFKKADIILVPRFGFDLYAGALHGASCDAALQMHLALVPYGVNGVGIKPPIYLFTDVLSERERGLRDAYFKHPGQRFEEFNSEFPTWGQAEDINGLIAIELKNREAAAA